MSLKRRAISLIFSLLVIGALALFIFIVAVLFYSKNFKTVLKPINTNYNTTAQESNKVISLYKCSTYLISKDLQNFCNLQCCKYYPNLKDNFCTIYNSLPPEIKNKINNCCGCK